MGKSFVYNAGSSQDDILKDELRFNFGVFFDGTLNNMKNTKLRKLYRDKDFMNNEKKDDYQFDSSGEKARDTARQAEEENYSNIDSSGFSDEHKAYLEASHRNSGYEVWKWTKALDKMGVDNSFANDFTNVARMFMGCNEDYRIYIEGIGTEDVARDTDDGFQYGSGSTGIRSKVRKGCNELAKRIQIAIKKKENKEKKTKITITLDVFGFSRGAAAARNFVHEVNQITAKLIPKKVQDGYYTENHYSKSETLTPKYKTIFTDSDLEEIDVSLLEDNKMPKMGHLGYSFLVNKISPEDLENIKVEVRFIGLYDTVSSYEEKGDLKDDNTLGKGAVHVIASSLFQDDEEALNLHDLKATQIVHFTAKNEHRENFDLTRLLPGKISEATGKNNRKEKNFPGVHCDIGGAYENGLEKIDEIETSQPNTLGHVTNALNFFTTKANLNIERFNLQEFKEELIFEHWFNDSQLVISDDLIQAYKKLTGTRMLRKEYSYIPLHFMGELAKDYLQDKLVTSMDASYPLGDDQVLNAAKKRLRKYVMAEDNELEWEYDDKIHEAERVVEYDKAYENFKKNVYPKIEAQRKEEIEKRISELKKEREIAQKRPSSGEYSPGLHGLYDYGYLRDDHRNEKTIEEDKKNAFSKTSEYSNYDTLDHYRAFKGYTEDNILKILRNQYFHWSSNRDWMGMDPRKNRIRLEHPLKKNT
ncbi:DUF2235 domain-containing protein [Flavobacterium sp. ZT3R18]|uniref:phospholipase effector Tle1 domain-containing protein n=1 Tax=Flavobacterium sp. ZT3R18 TaxID=2594429 RepID=UPI00117AAEB8|nr:DUF2235 domain-containing protein [Flavobacterium sp. ZT3R18]TRX30456.1 DUF2235 domain-containing protein [Flavobacterium sp. ZT3R18]